MKRKAFTGGRTNLTESQVRGMRKMYKETKSISYVAKAFHQSYFVARNLIRKITYRKVK